MAEQRPPYWEMDPLKVMIHIPKQVNHFQNIL